MKKTLNTGLLVTASIYELFYSCKRLR
uniref:NheA protein n=1 Tax=Bacillus cereus TaxID=1396 RepID=D6CJH6_BACCE|nr:NheA protein [Bacillus cereus]